MNKKFDRQNSFGWMINVLAGNASKNLDHQLKQHGLTLALWPTLMCLWEEEGITQKDIAIRSKVENSTTTRTLDKLEKLDLVERRADPNSRRSFRIYLTEKGKTLKDVILPIPIQINKELLSPLNESEQKQVLKLLKKIVANI